MNFNVNYIPLVFIPAVLYYGAANYEAKSYYLPSDQIRPSRESHSSPFHKENRNIHISVMTTGSTASGSTVIVCDISNGYGYPTIDGSISSPVQPDIESQWKQTARESSYYESSRKINCKFINQQHLPTAIRRFPRSR